MIENKNNVFDSKEIVWNNEEEDCLNKTSMTDLKKEEFTTSQNLTIYGNDEQRAKMFEAMTLYYGEVQNPANTTINNFFKTKYAPLNEVLNTIRPIMSKFGLSCTQTTGVENGECMVATLLLHKSGGCIYYPVLKAKPSKSDVQGIGATITYLRRFSLNAVLGVCGEVDDDGNKASDSNETKPKPKKLLTKREELVEICKTKAANNRPTVTEILKEYATDGAIKDIPEEKLDEVIKKIGEIK